MLLTRRQKNKAYSDPKLYDPGQQVNYISRNIHKIHRNLWRKYMCQVFMFGKGIFFIEKCIGLYLIFKLSAGTWLTLMTINTFVFLKM